MPDALDALAASGIDPERRAETLSVEDFVSLARRIDATGG
jgi:16S rRNA (adenine1518-N6/adenine1519-N6)-dimethyltransferase